MLEVMGCQGFLGYLLKPRNFLIVVLVFGIYNQVVPVSSLPFVLQIQSVFENLPIERSELRQNTPNQQYAKVQKRTFGSRVMKYVNKEMGEKLSMILSKEPKTISLGMTLDQQEASFLSLILMALRPRNETLRKEAEKELDRELAHRDHVDCVIEQIAKAISPNDFHWLIDHSSPTIVEDWDCYDQLLRTYEDLCGGFSTYAIQYAYVFANMCNNGTQQSRLLEAVPGICGDGGKC